MIDNSTNKFLGGVGMIEPIIASGKSLGIKLLSVYDFYGVKLCIKIW